MPAFNLDTEAHAIAARLTQPDILLVACLCAQWCDACRAYQTLFNSLADTHQSICFVWIDIETHADQLDEIEVEDFPTILIENAYNTCFFGTVLPYAAVVERLLASLTSGNKVTTAPKLRPLLTAHLP
ncbi:MAG: Thioredoxin [Glomeribacter sp. 1016415]|uniref:Thioredoxin domain-containing protein n=1 Tax=Mycoavidus cysteinexigens TaxID=1553431 RepID=A0A2Z6EYH9_9BURK|nr:thioredoxin family protein [Mycoavidus cysteinexigens]MCX8566116.1 Thioredoxin [Glomeribacter sp. 1016415]BBE10468.1 thioredoxin domain-containing protein [Mycoavidus cysteinexigens]GAM53152.1 thiol-disulfide isomerase and thioredoxins [bacterium endosymbiont of Mortierella elongata FMR23-6]GLR01830.1 thiol reductase thioredoxin [Mycoavidus cysteinexigens]